VRVFIDACVDPRAAEILEGHEVETAHRRGWRDLKDNILLARLRGRFDVLITIDRGIEFEHNLQHYWPPVSSTNFSTATE
jgi:predicted nuclease of predicted toxin-antitoxin system